jgi:hypothetical protein
MNNGRAERSEPGIMAFDGYEPRFGGFFKKLKRPETAAHIEQWISSAGLKSPT